MLYRKIDRVIRERLREDGERIPVVSGARQIGKSFIIRHVGKDLFRNYVELNLIEDVRLRDDFGKVRTVEEFYLVLSSYAGANLGDAADTLVFIDEIQECPHLLTLLKFLREDGRYRYVASGSMLGLTLHHTHSIPIGSIEIIPMYPLDFEEFMIAAGSGEEAIGHLRECFMQQKSPVEGVHRQMLDLFRRYLLVGGMPAAVNEYLDSHNLVKVREVQRDIHTLYAADASKYDEEHRLKIRRIYDLIPSNMENKKKRVVYRDIDNRRIGRSADYEEEMEYLISSGVALAVNAISNPKFPLIETERKNLLKLYLNDVGLLSSLLFNMNPSPILRDEESINLGSLYECVVATELAAHGHRLFYYDNRHYGEVDYLVDDYSTLSVMPIEVKSGKDYRIHSALTRFVSTPDYHIRKGIVLSNSGEVESRDGIVYMPVYMAMFIDGSGATAEEILI